MHACARVHIWNPDPERGAHAFSYLDLFSNTGFNCKQAVSTSAIGSFVLLPSILYQVRFVIVKLFLVFPPPVFIYSMPGYSCNIKERMLYSSCKSRLLEEVERDYRLEIAKKVEEGRKEWFEEGLETSWS